MNEEKENIEAEDELDEGTDLDTEKEGSEGDDAPDAKEEDADPFAALYEDDEEEEEDEGDEDEGDEGDEESDESGEAPKKEESELEREAKALLKQLGYKETDDPVASLKRVAAEAKGESGAEYDRRVAWERQAEEDIKAIHEAFPETKKYKSLSELPHKLEFARFMDDKKVKLTAVQAFSASHPEIVDAHVAGAKHSASLAGTKDHIRSAVPKDATSGGSSISRAEMREYREMFPGASDKEIRELYRKATK